MRAPLTAVPPFALLSALAVLPALLAGCGTTLLPSDAGADAGTEGAPLDPGTLVLATAQDLPHDVAVDAAHVYFTSIGDRAVKRVPLRGGVTKTLLTDEHGPTNLALDDVYVYFGDYGRGDVLFVDGRVGRVAKDGTGPVVYLASDVPTVGAVLVDGDYVYYASMGTTMGGVYQDDGQLWRVRKDGAAPAEPLTAKDQRVPVGVAVDEAHVYWASSYGGAIARCPKAGCAGAPEVLYQGQNEPRALVVDDAWAYWASPQATALFRAPKAGGGPVTEIASSRGLPDGLVLAQGSSELFWVEPVSHAVLRMPKEGGTRPASVASDLGIPVAVALDADSVYFSDEGRGTILRVPR